MDWKQYEQHVYDVFRKRYRSLYVVNKNEKVEGRYSKVKRQIDVTMRPDANKKNALTAIECKKYSRKINVKSIDSFIGFLEDIGASIGIFVTNKGYSKGAENRAKYARISLEILNPTQLEQSFFSGDVLCAGVCIYKCESCGEEKDFYCRDLDFEIVETDEREMGTEYCHSARWDDICECGEAIEIVVNVWEYPWGDPGYLDIETFGCKILKTGFFRVVREREIQEED